MQLPKQYVPKEVESKWRARWQKGFIAGILRALATRLSLWTSPPTVSGSPPRRTRVQLHPSGFDRAPAPHGWNEYLLSMWDDNGLPTERRVQNFFNVRCDPYLPYLPNLNLEVSEGTARNDQPAKLHRTLPTLTQIDEQAFQELWQQLGLSIDWEQEYATIDDHCRRTSQLSF